MAEPFEHLRAIDGKEMPRGRYDRPPGEMEETTFDMRWKRACRGGFPL
ncbi:hypothetical protein J7M22_05960 [Candidatus Poribacteria bacterium]|nr:hypothetical protein [Candidatus Poribacteria bacterium]